MSEITRTSYKYDPVRQGYDTNSWRTVTGAPSVVGGRLSIDNEVGIAGSAIHYADLLKGDISFNVNVPVAPVAGTSRLFGVAALSSTAYIRFSVGSTLTCQTSDGTTTTESSEILWNSDWTGSDVIFRIRWEAGTAKFFINGVQVYAVSDASIPYGPLSLYLFDNAETAMTVGDMNVRGTQSFVMNLATSDSSTTVSSGTLSRFETVTLTENIVMFQPTYTPEISDSITITEVITITI